MLPGSNASFVLNDDGANISVSLLEEKEIHLVQRHTYISMGEYQLVP